MTWTLDLTTATGRIRSLTGDTVSTDPLLSDEEIALYTGEPTELLAAARCAEAIAGKMARRVDMSGGGSSASLSQQATHYRQLAKDLRRQNAMSSVPYVGGVSESVRDAREADTDRVAPAFTRQMGDASEEAFV